MNSISGLRNNAIGYNEEKKKKMMKLLAIAALVIVVIAVIVLLVLFVANKKENVDNLYTGNWICSSGFTMDVNNNEFTMEYQSQNAIVKGTYEVKGQSEKENAYAYLIDFQAKTTMVNGKTNYSSTMVQYELNVAKENRDVITMINTSNYSIYNCQRLK